MNPLSSHLDNELIDEYEKLRAQLEEERLKWVEVEQKYQQQMKVIEAELMSRINERGSNIQLKQNGKVITVGVKSTVRHNIADRAAFISTLEELRQAGYDPYTLFEARLSQSEVRAMLKQLDFDPNTETLHGLSMFAKTELAITRRNSA